MLANSSWKIGAPPSHEMPAQTVSGFRFSRRQLVRAYYRKSVKGLLKLAWMENGLAVFCKHSTRNKSRDVRFLKTVTMRSTFESCLPSVHFNLIVVFVYEHLNITWRVAWLDGNESLISGKTLQQTNESAHIHFLLFTTI